LKKIIEIFTGWRNLFFGNPETKEMAEARMKICTSCDHASEKIYLHCSACGCYIPAKANSKESDCPMNYWDNEEYNN
jgi:hypothetical protein